MTRKTRIYNCLNDQFHPETLMIEDESARHNVPKGAESHFKLTLVASAFESLSRIARHRLVNKALASEFNTGLHALSLHLFTPAEWEARNASVRNSPPCHKAKRDE